jgi:regulator of sigma E protease
VLILLTIIVAILVFNAIVLIHEGGHYIAARLSGIKVVEFALGMGPKLFGVKRGDTLYAIRALPIGGLCLMLGEDEENKDPASFNSKPLINRVATVAAGPIINMLTAVIIYSLVITPVSDPVIGQVAAGLPAEKAGIIAGEKLIAINDIKISSWEDIKPAVSKFEGEEITVTLESKGTEKKVTLVPVKNTNTGDIVIGVSQSIRIGGFSFSEGIKTTTLITKEMFGFLGQLFTGKANTEEVGGPISIIVFMNEAAKTGFISVLFLTAIISLNLAILNLLPIPALDGGRLLFFFIEAIRRKPIEAEKEGLVHFVGLVALMAFSIFMIYRDMIRFNILNIFG